MTVPVRVAVHGDDPDQDDRALIERSRERPELFAAVYDRYFVEIHRYLARRLGADVADDLAAEVFLTAFEKRAHFDAARGRLRPWLYGIATTLIARHRRAEKRRYRALARMVPHEAAEDHGDRVAARVTAQALRLAPAVRKLASGDRDVLLLVVLGGLSYAEVAEALGIPLGTVGSRMNRARRKLRRSLGESNPLISGQETRDG
ncbi:MULTISPECIES: RNA polymerase sigma factor [Thermomonospora]|uniref:RNA polymerase, sigma-24 subunit, ECF subfamily n=1 Tax=Thermomonospora curvata (strain ATCC 19995 / DSM 43183 / JCM 3096 / KCTC 9072 / NBRC 15933 / NCIMB 10081 / Henssen B9) TaxID=471852 RepID=D1A393_THECD|nr:MULTISPECIES: RNA polymerase sigma factor [Thermomonospora]ACY99863.1 RNA polymerase, sigma-24 subunit, ECF subfamily [Thermomonospora curvata DSM 43183]PKK12866.1 MAG: RNA polymerase sigma factor [Thermomonospora sp. CIF 1]